MEKMEKTEWSGVEWCRVVWCVVCLLEKGRERNKEREANTREAVMRVG